MAKHMKVAIISSHDLEGGAGKAAYRLFEALRRAGTDAQMFVQRRASLEAHVHGPSGSWNNVKAGLRWRLDHAPAQLTGARRGEFSVGWMPGGMAMGLKEFSPDVVHVHWVQSGFVSLGELASLSVPWVWTAHDMWPFTGGCHYDNDCERFATNDCRPCPMQRSRPNAPLARWRLRAKTHLTNARMAFVAPSQWMAGVARRSPVARKATVRCIANGIDLNRFVRLDREAARSLFGLALDRVVILLGAANVGSDLRKGAAQLEQALARLAGSDSLANAQLCVFGTAVRRELVLHGVPVLEVGHLRDEESLVALYSAADLFVAPSLQDNLPNTVLEAMACGLPCVAFNIGGMADLINDGVSGRLAAQGDVGALALCIQQVLSDSAWRAAAGRAARRRAEEYFSYSRLAAEHTDLYGQLLLTKSNLA